MATLAMVNTEIAAGPVRLSGVSNEVKVELDAAMLESTVFTSQGWRTFVPGLESSTVDVSGYFDSSPLETGGLAPDAEIWGQLGTAVPVTISPDGTDQDIAYVIPTIRGNVELFGKVGDLAGFGGTMRGTGAVGRGRVLHPATVTRTAGGTGTTAILGTVPTGQSILAAIHVLAVTGTTPQLTVTIQRDDNAGFTTPTTVAVLGPVSAPQATLTTVAGPITPDDRYRVIWTLTGTTPSARFLAAVGVTK